MISIIVIVVGGIVLWQNLGSRATDNQVIQNESSDQYISYSKNALTSNKNVIFFAASWCSTCRSLDKAINSELSKIPVDLTIFKADYDKETSLKQKYGVTFQHTLVQVDKEGNIIKKWSGSGDLSDIVSKLE